MSKLVMPLSRRMIALSLPALTILLASRSALEAQAFRACPRRSVALRSSTIGDRDVGVDIGVGIDEDAAPTASSRGRRDFVEFLSKTGQVAVLSLVGATTIAAAPAGALVQGSKPTDSVAVIPRDAYKKLDSGVVYADILAGTGEEVRQGSKVNLQWVLRRSNGYFVDSSEVSGGVPFIFKVGDAEGAILGLDEGVRGMRSGGKRRIIIPPRLAWISGVDDGKPGPIPVGYGPRQQMRTVMKLRKDVPDEYIYLEVKVTKVR